MVNDYLYAPNLQAITFCPTQSTNSLHVICMMTLMRHDRPSENAGELAITAYNKHCHHSVPLQTLS